MVRDGHYEHIIFSIEVLEEDRIIYRVGQGMFIMTNNEDRYLLPRALWKHD